MTIGGAPLGVLPLGGGELLTEDEPGAAMVTLSQVEPLAQITQVADDDDC